MGEWQNDQRHGQGTLRFDKRHMRTADWIAEDHVKRVECDFSGDTYVGGWREDLRHGQGVYTFANGDVYEGG